MIKLIISGCNGKMGGVVTKIAAEDEIMETVAGFDINTDNANGYEVYDNPENYKERADVIIDFSHTLMFEKTIDYSVKTKTPIVVATTGLDENQKKKMLDASKEIPVFFSANMSVGVNLIIELAQKAAKALEQKYEIEIIE